MSFYCADLFMITRCAAHQPIEESQAYAPSPQKATASAHLQDIDLHPIKMAMILQ